MLGPGEVDRLTVGVAFAVDAATEARAKASVDAMEAETVRLTNAIPAVSQGLADYGARGLSALGAEVATVSSAALALGTIFAGLAISTAQTADAYHDLGIRSGLTVEEVQSLGYAADRTGTTLDVMSQGLLTLQRQINAARNGGKDAADEFSALGLDPKKLAKAKDALPQVADALAKVSDEGERTRLRMLLLGEAGPRMAEFLELGADGLAALTAQSKTFKGEITDAQSELSGDFLNDMEDFALLANRVGHAVGFELVRPMHGFVDVLHDFAGERVDEYADRLTYAIGKIPQPVKSATYAALGLAAAWGGVGVARSLAEAAGQASPLVATLLAQAGALKGAAVAAGPYALALVAAGLVVDDFATAVEGGDAEVLRLAEHLGVKGEAQHALVAFNDLLKETAGLAWDLGGALGDGIGDALERLGQLFPEIDPYLQAIRAILQGGLAGALEGAANAASRATSGGKAIRAELAEGGLSGLVDSGLLGPKYVAPGVYSLGGQMYVPTQSASGGTINVPVSINTAGMTPAQIADEAAAQVRQQVLNAQAALGAP
jgi:hypothetical protein